MPAAMMRETASPAASVESNAASSVWTASGRGRIRSATSVTMPSVPSEPTTTPSRSRPGASGTACPSCAMRPSGSTNVAASTWWIGEAVLQAVRAAGVLRDVAADRADLLARRVGRVVVAVRRDAPRDVEVGDAGLHGDALVRRCRRRARECSALQRRSRCPRRPAARRPRARCRRRAPRTARLPRGRCEHRPRPRPSWPAAPRPAASRGSRSGRRRRRTPSAPDRSSRGRRRPRG